MNHGPLFGKYFWRELFGNILRKSQKTSRSLAKLSISMHSLGLGWGSLYCNFETHTRWILEASARIRIIISFTRGSLYTSICPLLLGGWGASQAMIYVISAWLILGEVSLCPFKSLLKYQELKNNPFNLTPLKRGPFFSGKSPPFFHPEEVTNVPPWGPRSWSMPWPTLGWVECQKK